VPSEVATTTDADGAFSVTLWANAEGSQEATYLAELNKADAFEVAVPAGLGSVTLSAIRVPSAASANWSLTVQALIDDALADVATDAELAALVRHVTAQTLTDAASVVWDTSAGHLASVTLGGNRTLAAPTNGVAGTYILCVTQDGAGGRTLAYNAAFKWADGTAPVLSTAIGAVDVLSFVSLDGAVFYGALLGDFS
jgi:hypothetical protein